MTQAFDPAAALASCTAGRFTIDRELGRGGMGVVLLARDRGLDRLVAIKVLPPEMAAQPSLRERFLRETRLAAGLFHPNIVPIYSVEEHGGLVFFVMGYIEGETLTSRIARLGRLSPSETARVMQEAGWALSYAHGRGIIHRDIKSDNLLFERTTGRVFLTDFGIARTADSMLTAVGESLGTPEFMSPEQAAGDAVDPRSDLYSLGVVGYHALSGRLPFEAPTARAIMAMQVSREAVPLGSLRADAPPGLVRVIERCLRKDPAERWPDGDALVAGITQAEGTTVVHVASPVRGFQRAAEVAGAQLLTMVFVLVPILLLRPAAADLLLVALTVMAAATAYQLIRRARALLDQGFSYRDVRAGFHADLREQAAIRSDVEPATSRATVGVLLLGLVLAGLGMIASTRWPRESGVGLAVRGVLLVGLVLAAGSVAVRVRRRIGERGAGRLAARFWTSAGGEWVFRLAESRRRPVTEAQLPSGLTSPGQRAEDAFRALPRAARHRIRQVPRTLADLAGAVSAIEAHRRRLAEGLAAITSTRGPDNGPDAGDGESASGGDLRRDLQAALARTAALTPRLNQLLEDIRVTLIGIGAGLRDVGDIDRQADRAATLVTEARQLTAPVTTP